MLRTHARWLALVATPLLLTACPAPRPLPFRDGGTLEGGRASSITTRVTAQGDGPNNNDALFPLRGGYRVEAGARSAYVATALQVEGSRTPLVRYAMPRSAGHDARDVYLIEENGDVFFVGDAHPDTDPTARGLIVPARARVGMRWEWRHSGGSVRDRFEVTARATERTPFGEATVWTIRRENELGASETRYVEGRGPLADTPEASYVVPLASSSLPVEPPIQPVVPDRMNGAVVPQPPSRNVRLSAITRSTPDGDTVLVLEGDRAEGDHAPGTPAHTTVCLWVRGNELLFADAQDARERHVGNGCPRTPSGEVWGDAGRAEIYRDVTHWIDREVAAGDRTFAVHATIGSSSQALAAFATELREGRAVGAGLLRFEPWDVALPQGQSPPEGAVRFERFEGEPFALLPSHLRTPTWATRDNESTSLTGFSVLAGLPGNHLAVVRTSATNVTPALLVPPLPGSQHVHRYPGRAEVISLSDDGMIDLASPAGVVGAHLRLAQLRFPPGHRPLAALVRNLREVIAFTALEVPARDGARATLQAWIVPTLTSSGPWSTNVADVVHYPLGYDLLVCSASESGEFDTTWQLGGRPAAHVASIPGQPCALVMRDFDPATPVPQRAGDPVPPDFFAARGGIPSVGPASLAHTMPAWSAAQDAPRLRGRYPTRTLYGEVVTTTHRYTAGLVELGSLAEPVADAQPVMPNARDGRLFTAGVSRVGDGWRTEIRRVGGTGNHYEVRSGTGTPPPPPVLLCPAAEGVVGRDEQGVFAFDPRLARVDLPAAITDPTNGIRVQARVAPTVTGIPGQTCGARLDGRGVACIDDRGERRERLAPGLDLRNPLDPTATDVSPWVPLGDDRFLVWVEGEASPIAEFNATTLELVPRDITRVYDVTRETVGKFWVVVEREGQRQVGVLDETGFVPYGPIGYRLVAPPHADMSSVTRIVPLRGVVYLLAGERHVGTLVRGGP